MASSSGNDRDKGKRPLSGVMSLLCFKPKTSEDNRDQEPHPWPSLPLASDSGSDPDSPSAGPATSAGACRLMIDCQDFSVQIGKGEYGEVYEGWIINSNKKHEKRYSNLMFGDSLVGPFEKWTRVALKAIDKKAMKVIPSWLSEVRNHGNLHSPHFVKLITITEYTKHPGEPGTVLVYEFLANKSLQDCLFDDSSCLLTWDLRVNIALLAAEGLLYLHEGMGTQMIYGEVKASNILLDESFKPRLAFFCLSQSREISEINAATKYFTLILGEGSSEKLTKVS